MTELKITRYTGTGTVTVVTAEGEHQVKAEPRAGQKPALRLVQNDER